MIFRGNGNGKLILFGEHAAVYGYPATGIPLKDSITIEWDDSTAYSVKPVPEDSNEDRNEDEYQTICRLFELIASREKNFHIPEIWTLKGSVPRFGGFGSSAALCTALARAVFQRNYRGYDRDVHRLSNFLEGYFHGTPSGIDTGMACDSEPGIWRYCDSDVPTREPLRLPECHLVYGAFTRHSNTAETVGSVRTGMENKNHETVDSIAGLGCISEDFIALTEKASSYSECPASFAEETGRLANMAHTKMSNLGLSIPELDSLLTVVQNYGASGGKLSGGGSGGAFWLIFPDAQTRDRAVNSLPDILKEKGISPAIPLTPLSPGAYS